MQIDNDSKQIRKIINREIEKREISGAQAACWIEGKKQCHEICGMADIEKEIESCENTIYRIYSMTKPITAVAAMILSEKGMLDLDAPVGYYLPEYNNMRIGSNDIEQDVRRLLTVKSLLNMTSGIVYPDNDRVGKIMESIFCTIENNIKNNGGFSTREVAKKIAECPLAFEPGTSWRYGFSADVLGAVLEEAAQLRLSRLYQKEIFECLDMKDTAFYVPEEKKKRFCQLYKKENGRLVIDKKRHIGLTFCEKPPAFESGGAGLVSTMKDYGNFANMLAMGGEWKGKRLLRRETVLAFSQNCLSYKQKKSMNFPYMKGFGYSHLMRVLMYPELNNNIGNIGEFGWDGWTGSYVSVDPRKKSVMLFFTQVSAYQNRNIVLELRKKMGI